LLQQLLAATIKAFPKLHLNTLRVELLFELIRLQPFLFSDKGSNTVCRVMQPHQEQNNLICFILQ